MPTITSKTRQAFVRHLVEEQGLNLNQVKFVASILDCYEDDFILLFKEVLNIVENRFELKYEIYDGYDPSNNNYTDIENECFNKININILETENYNRLYQYIVECELNSNIYFQFFVEGIMSFIFYADISKRLDFPDLGKIEISLPH